MVNLQSINRVFHGGGGGMGGSKDLQHCLRNLCFNVPRQGLEKSEHRIPILDKGGYSVRPDSVCIFHVFEIGSICMK